MESHTAAASLLDIYDEPKSNAKIVQKALIQGQFPPIVCVTLHWKYQLGKWNELSMPVTWDHLGPIQGSFFYILAKK